MVVATPTTAAAATTVAAMAAVAQNAPTEQMVKKIRNFNLENWFLTKKKKKKKKDVL
jgi:hypothetical protein